MAEPARLYTPAEAGAVSGLKLKAVHNAIDKHIVEPVAKVRAALAGKVNPVASRFLSGEDLVRLRVWRGVGDTLSAERRERLFLAIAARPTAKTLRADDLLIVDVGEARKQVDRGVRDLEAAEAIITKDKATLGGEPVFKGTRIPVYGIAAMLDAGATVDDLISGYPKLTERMLGLARIWATAHPRRGRPKSMSDLGLTMKSTRRVPRKGDPGRSEQGAAADGRVNFLIDECLHTSLVEVAVERGHEATHVNYRGLSGVQDWDLMAPIRDGEFTFVTNNAKDFRRLYAREDVHAGLVILIPNVPPSEQRELFDAVLGELEVAPGLINEALEVRIEEGDIQIAWYELPGGV